MWFARVAAAVILLVAAGGCVVRDQDEFAIEQIDERRTSPAVGDAATVIRLLDAAGLGLTNVAVQTTDDDPEGLLGRPDGYVSRASADLPGGDYSRAMHTVDRGLVVEAFPTVLAAKARIKVLGAAMPAPGSPAIGKARYRVTGAGRVLVRISGLVSPALAAEVGDAAATL
jgi:hypothetical protein